MVVEMEKSNVDMLKRSWRIKLVINRLLRKLVRMNKRDGMLVPAGCFPVYVGEGDQKERFVVRTEHANHPLFMSLLEDAKSEYGLCCQGPLSLPCRPDFFLKVLAEMEYSHQHDRSCSGDNDDDNNGRMTYFPVLNLRAVITYLNTGGSHNPKIRCFTSKLDDKEKQCRHASRYRLFTPPNSLLTLNPHGRSS